MKLWKMLKTLLTPDCRLSIVVALDRMLGRERYEESDLMLVLVPIAMCYSVLAFRTYVSSSRPPSCTMLNSS